MGSFLYCLAQLPVLKLVAEEFGPKGTLVLSYADDAGFTGPPEETVKAFRRYKELYEMKLQGELRDSKSLVYSPCTALVVLRGYGLPTSVPYTNLGFKMLGAAVGSQDFCRDFLQEKISALQEDLQTLALVPSLQAQHVLLCKSLARRVNHLLRTLPGCGDPQSDHFILLQGLDDELRRAISRSAGTVVEKGGTAWALASLSARQGGLGLAVPTATADAAFIAAYHHSRNGLLEMMPDVFKELFPSLPVTPKARAPLPYRGAQNQAAFEAATRLMQSAPGVANTWIKKPGEQEESRRPPAHLQRQISAALAEVNGQRIMQDLSSDRDRAMVLSHAGDSVSSQVIPNSPDRVVPNGQWRIAVKRRLLLPIFNFGESASGVRCALCGNGTVIDPNGDHLLVCPKVTSGSRTVDWHDKIVSSAAGILRRYGVPHRAEPRGLIPFSDMRPDVVVRPTPREGDGGGVGEAHPYLLDVRTCVAAGAGGNALKQAAVRQGYAADLGEHAKIRKWELDARSQGYRFLGLCIEEGGRLSEGLKQFLDPKLWCVKHAASFRVFARNHIHITNLKAVTRVIQVNSQILLPAAFRVPDCILDPGRLLPSAYHRRASCPVLPKLAPRKKFLPDWASSGRDFRGSSSAPSIPQRPFEHLNLESEVI